MFRHLIPRIHGSLDALVDKPAYYDLCVGAIKLVEDSLTCWADEDWCRFDDEENSCTVRVYGFAKELSRFTNYRVSYDAAHPSKDMLEGKVSVRSAPRPDLIIHMGNTDILVECKRLGTHSSHPSEYVKEGIDRFVTGTYGTPHGFGLMIGYVQKGDPARWVRAINRNIMQHSKMDESHCLALGPSKNRHQSVHLRPNRDAVRLEHFVRRIGPSHHC